MDYKSVLTDYIQKEILRGRGTNLKADQDLLSAGIIDSLGILQLVSFIETRFGIRVADEDVVFENFNSIQTMVAYIESHR